MLHVRRRCRARYSPLIVWGRLESVSDFSAVAAPGVRALFAAAAGDGTAGSPGPTASRAGKRQVWPRPGDDEAAVTHRMRQYVTIMRAASADSRFASLCLLAAMRARASAPHAPVSAFQAALAKTLKTKCKAAYDPHTGTQEEGERCVSQYLGFFAAGSKESIVARQATARDGIFAASAVLEATPAADAAAATRAAFILSLLVDRAAAAAQRRAEAAASAPPPFQRQRWLCRPAGTTPRRGASSQGAAADSRATAAAATDPNVLVDSAPEGPTSLARDAGAHGAAHQFDGLGHAAAAPTPVYAEDAMAGDGVPVV